MIAAPNSQPAAVTSPAQSAADSRLIQKKRRLDTPLIPNAMGNAVRKPHMKRIPKIDKSGWRAIHASARSILLCMRGCLASRRDA